MDNTNEQPQVPQVAPVVESDKQIKNSSEKSWLFKPGQSGNPAGRPPKEKVFTNAMEAIIKKNPKIMEAIAAKMLQMAVNGNMDAIKEMADRLEGKSVSSMDLTADKQIGVNVNIKDYAGQVASSVVSYLSQPSEEK